MELFRKEVAANKAGQQLGSVIFVAERSTSAILAFALGFVVLLIIFISSFSYTSKIRVSALVAVESGLVQVAAPTSGVVTRIVKSDGLSLREGDVIARISSDRNTPVGSLSDEKRSYTEKKVVALRREIDLREELARQKLKRIRDEVTSLEAQVKSSEESRRIQAQRLAALNQALMRFESLVAQGFIASTQLDDRKDRILEQSSRLKEAEMTETATRKQLAESRYSLQTQSASAEVEISDLKRQLATIESEAAVVNAEAFQLIKAPTDGKIGGMIVREGQYVREGQTLLTVEPDTGKFMAALFVPLNKIGGVRVGQRVSLRFDAYPYQKYGLFGGVVVAVSSVPLSSSDAVFDMGKIGLPENEPVFRVNVALDNQRGRREPPVRFRSGMRAEADIALETRRILEWLAKPFVDGIDGLQSQSKTS